MLERIKKIRVFTKYSICIIGPEKIHVLIKNMVKFLNEKRKISSELYYNKTAAYCYSNRIGEGILFFRSIESVR